MDTWSIFLFEVLVKMVRFSRHVLSQKVIKRKVLDQKVILALELEFGGRFRSSGTSLNAIGTMSMVLS